MTFQMRDWKNADNDADDYDFCFNLFNIVSRLKFQTKKIILKQLYNLNHTRFFCMHIVNDISNNSSKLKQKKTV
jgi:hypothetical protein